MAGVQSGMSRSRQTAKSNVHGRKRRTAGLALEGEKDGEGHFAKVEERVHELDMQNHTPGVNRVRDPGRALHGKQIRKQLEVGEKRGLSLTHKEAASRVLLSLSASVLEHFGSPYLDGHGVVARRAVALVDNDGVVALRQADSMAWDEILELVVEVTDLKEALGSLGPGGLERRVTKRGERRLVKGALCTEHAAAGHVARPVEANLEGPLATFPVAKSTNQ